MDFLRIAEWAGLCLFVAPALLVDLRLLGVASRHVRVSAVVQYVLPWTSTGFAVMAAARVVHLLATPTGLLSQPAFLVHLVLLGLLGLNVALFHRGVFLHVKSWDLGPVPPRARLTGLISVMLFAGIVATAWAVAATSGGLPGWSSRGAGGACLGRAKRLNQHLVSRRRVIPSIPSARIAR